MVYSHIFFPFVFTYMLIRLMYMSRNLLYNIPAKKKTVKGTDEANEMKS